MSALDELKSMIREKGGNTNVSSLAEALREYNKYDDASGGGSEIVEVLFEAAYAEGATLPTITCDHTAEEIVAAKEAGKHVVCSLKYDTSTSLYVCCVEQDIGRADDETTPYVMVKFLEHYANASAATSEDNFGFMMIGWDSSYSKWNAELFYYAMTPST